MRKPEHVIEHFPRVPGKPAAIASEVTGSLQASPLANSAPAGSAGSPIYVTWPKLEYPRVVLNVFKLDLSLPRGGGLTGDGEKLDIRGTVLWLIHADSDSAYVEVQFNGEGGWVPFKRGTKIGGVPFDFVRVRHQGQPINVATFMYATDAPAFPLTDA